MELEVYNNLVKDVFDFQSESENLRTERDTAAAKLQVARLQLSDIVALTAGNPSEAQEVVIAQANLTIAAEQLRQAETKLAELPDKPAGVARAYMAVRSAVSQAIKDGSIFVDFQKDLDELGELRRRYNEKLLSVLANKGLLNRELATIQKKAAEIQQQYGEKCDFGAFNWPVLIDNGDLSRWIWVGADYQNQFSEIEKKAQ